MIENQEQYSPSCIHDENILSKSSADYMYLSCISHIKESNELSPMLINISKVQSWDKISQGMLKMYQAEVIGKYDIIKQLKFGTIFKYGQ